MNIVFGLIIWIWQRHHVHTKHVLVLYRAKEIIVVARTLAIGWKLFCQRRWVVTTFPTFTWTLGITTILLILMTIHRWTRATRLFCLSYIVLGDIFTFGRLFLSLYSTLRLLLDRRFWRYIIILVHEIFSSVIVSLEISTHWSLSTSCLLLSILRYQSLVAWRLL